MDGIDWMTVAETVPVTASVFAFSLAGAAPPEAGLVALGSWDPLPVGPELIDYWRRQLGKAERLVLEALVNVYPAALSKAEIAVQTGYEANGGGFNNALGRLRTLELIEGRGELPGATSAVMELCVDNPREGFSDLFATHPSVESRVQALVKYAGGHYEGRLALPMRPDDQAERPEEGQSPPPLPGAPHGPWGSPTDPRTSQGAPEGAPQDAPQGPWGNPAGPWGRH